MARIPKTLLSRRFELLAKEMGWDYIGPGWIPREDGKGSRAKVGHTFLEHNSVYGWSINQMVNEGGGERRIRESCSAAEMFAWLEGACYVAWELERRNQKAA